MDIRSIADYYGYESQSRQLIEEMGELTSAINHHWRKDLACGEKAFDPHRTSKELNHVIEEIADVELCLRQLIYLLKCDHRVDLFMEVKVKRQMDRMVNQQ